MFRHVPECSMFLVLSTPVSVTHEACLRESIWLFTICQNFPENRPGMESKWNTTFCRLRGRVGVKRGRGRGRGRENLGAQTSAAQARLFGSFHQKISGSNGTSEKVVLFFRTEYPNGNS